VWVVKIPARIQHPILLSLAVVAVVGMTAVAAVLVVILQALQHLLLGRPTQSLLAAAELVFLAQSVETAAQIHHYLGQV
jgi:hypothetical protein